ncbi:hypothetical protein, partial [Pseudomonas aeruginosa]|uniref:hypothetical protein n=1 Tax=Pseudomonas aeruginosa TaxID=287 RepID=UPI00406C08A9
PTSCSGSKRRSLNSLKNCLDRWVHFMLINAEVICKVQSAKLLRIERGEVPVVVVVTRPLSEDLASVNVQELRLRLLEPDNLPLKFNPLTLAANVDVVNEGLGCSLGNW